MSRITAPATKLARTLAESQRSTGAVLTPKYAELLGAPQQSQHSESRGLKTTHRPTPQPSIAGRTRPLMQTFHSSSPSRAPVNHVDTTVLPKIHPIPNFSEPLPRMPLLPDNYGAHHHSLSDAADLSSRPIILAVDPDVVVPGAPMATMDAVNIDGIDVKFVHEQPAASPEQEEYNPERSTFLRDMIRSMGEDLLGPKFQLKKN
ncbi:hypothetical protein ACHAPJ_006398 [Fusarium lateritium]